MPEKTVKPGKQRNVLSGLVATKTLTMGGKSGTFCKYPKSGRKVPFFLVKYEGLEKFRKKWTFQ